MSKKSSSGRNRGRIKIIDKMKYLLMVLKREAVTNPRKVNMNDVRTTPIKSSSGWSCIRIAGVLDLALAGILAELSGILVKAGIPIFAISTYNTDYILVKSDKLKNAVAALKGSGYLLIP